ncbi:DMT family transporter [Sinirhodobacter populi]|uniref:DMT family transporter n=1 Tax=Paenirhodobacter populi TaxID=2306993 RepID=A0A443KGI6_9RHOB|nr:DMT family transporter [Sinirhodobacter populi]RWR31881.1 DMT family transporter [Sinirhodobacter populi]
MLFSQKTLAVMAALVAVLLWGAVPVGTRALVGGEQARIAPVPLVGIRFALSGLVLLPFALRAKPWAWPRQDQGLALLAAGLGVVGYNLPVTLGQVYVPAGMTALIIATEPLWILLMWSALRRNLPSRPTIIGSALGLAGILVLLAPPLARGDRTGDLAGIVLVTLGAVAWSAYCITVPGLIRRHGALAVTAITVTLGCLPFLGLAAPDLAGALAVLTPADMAVILVLSLGSTVLATLIWNYATGILPGPTSGQFLYALPLAGVTAGHLLLGEPLTSAVLIAATLILAGLLLTRSRI